MEEQGSTLFQRMSTEEDNVPRMIEDIVAEPMVMEAESSAWLKG